jgi:predicted RNA binding protein YcfA (HicA-like mRNA interferase family)
VRTLLRPESRYEHGNKEDMKIRKVKQLLRRQGYQSRPGRGSHSVWRHPDKPERPIVVCGTDGSDAQPYLVAQVLKRKQERSSGPRKSLRKRRGAVKHMQRKSA